MFYLKSYDSQGQKTCLSFESDQDDYICPATPFCVCLSDFDGLPDSSVYLIFLAKIAEGVAISSSRVSSQPRDQTCVSIVSCIGRHILYCLATGLEKVSFHSNLKEKQCQRMLKLPHNCTHLTR